MAVEAAKLALECSRLLIFCASVHVAADCVDLSTARLGANFSVVTCSARLLDTSFLTFLAGGFA